MKLEALRWFLLPLAATALFVILFRGVSPRRLVFFSVCGLGWYALSRRKAYSLDRERLLPPRS